jgi:TatD DNase family protein
MIDSHAHLTSDALFDEANTLIERAKESGLTHIVNICTDLPTLERGLKLAEENPFIVNTAATTPHDVLKEGESFFPHVEKHAHNLVAIGETGLDYYYEHSPKDTQKKFFIRYLHLAKKLKKPVVIHCRDAFDDFFEIVDAEYGKNPLILHCFTGTLEEAKQVLKRGYYLSLSGIVTFKKSLELKEVAKITPLNQLLIETDAPYLAPNSRRGKRNEPSYIKETAEHIASLKGIPVEELIQATATNAKSIFNLDN